MGILILALLSSCGDDENTNNINAVAEDFEQISDRYPYEELEPSMEVDYWELIYSTDFQVEDILVSSGTKCQNASPQDDCIFQFDSFENNEEGFAEDCLPDFCFYYIKYNIGNETLVAANPRSVRDFLGTINTRSDAILLVFSNDYRFSTDIKEVGGIRKIPSGYELLVTKLISTCNPLRIDRFHLKVGIDGKIDILGSEIYDISDDCI
ncbi:hypothetical protein [uncultured Croceitalea sp.]|uniref:hypothetical protein n=1 Tax=uncultured Croceitalea sp. TaxID=1798908 RepID=UPI0033055C9B